MKKFFTVVGALTVLVFCVSCTRESEFEIYGSINGRIVDTETGEPVFNASVSLAPMRKTQTTRNDGWYEFIDLDPDYYTITVQANGYNTNRKSVMVKAGERADGDVPLTRE